MSGSIGSSWWRRGASLAVLGLAVVGTAPAGQDPVLRDAVAVIRRETDGTRLSLDSAAIRLGTRRITMASGGTVEQLLRAGGVAPDAEAWSAVFALNPGLTRPVTTGTQVVLPAVSGPDTLRWALGHGYLAYLTIDVTLKRRVARHASEVLKWPGLLAEQPAARLGGEESKGMMLEAARQVRDFATAVGLALEQRTRPVDREVLEQIDLELVAFDSTLRQFTSVKAPLDEATRSLVLAAAGDARLRSHYWRESMGPGDSLQQYPRFPIVVRTMRAGREVKGLRVYYSPRALFRRSEPGSFPRLTSPSAAQLPLANYILWAGSPGDVSPRSDLFRLEAVFPVRPVADTVDLVVTP